MNDLTILADLVPGLLPVLLPIARALAELLWWALPSTVQGVLLWQFVYLPLLLAALYPVAIQYERKGWWRLLFPLYALVGVLSAYLNYTTFALYLAQTPRKGENTFSQRLERLVFDPGWRGLLARAIARFTNRFDPSGPHVLLPSGAV